MGEVHRTTSLQDNRRRRKASKRTCAVCGRGFYGVKEVNGRFGSKNIRISKYCSRECWSIRATIYRKCKYCGKEIRTTKSENKQYCNNECRNKGYKYATGEKASAWKGDDVGYSAIHKWLNSFYGKPVKCDQCGSTDFVDWADKNGKYDRTNRDEWLHLCRRCHFYYDMHDLSFRRYP